MFVVLLRLSENKGNAAEFMGGHNEWIKQGFDDGVFLLAGSLQPNQEGTIVAHNTTREELQNRTSRDPFVIQKVVSSEILEITPAKADKRLDFLIGE